MSHLEIRRLTENDEQAFLNYVEACKNDFTTFGHFARHRYANFKVGDYKQLLGELQQVEISPKDCNQSRQISYFAFKAGKIVGSIRCRFDLDKDDLLLYGGHIGYDVPEFARGQHIAEEMCQFAFKHYLSVNITSILVTVDENNFASRHIIEKLGGQLNNWVYDSEDQAILARYWINLLK